MQNRFYKQFGPWKPFPEPLVPPIVDPREEPFLILKFNEAWRPYIVGCLSSLARPETYEDILDNFIREDIDNGGELPWLIQPYPVVAFYNWRHVQKPGDNGDSPIVIVESFTAPGIDGFYGSRFLGLDFDRDNAVQVTGVGLTGPGTYPVGGHVVSMFGFLLETVVGNTWSVERTDCLDNTVVDTFGGQDFEITDFDCKAFQIIALGSYFVSIIIDTNWECGPA